MNSHTAWIDPLRAPQHLICESLASASDRMGDESVRHAMNDALALAWTTPYPLLVLPVLLEEKLAAARRYSERQQLVRCRSLELLRRMGWQDATCNWMTQADRMPSWSTSCRKPDFRIADFGYNLSPEHQLNQESA
jgi:hypothetical protein